MSWHAEEINRGVKSRVAMSIAALHDYEVWFTKLMSNSWNVNHRLLQLPVSSNRKQTSKALSKALANTSLPLCRGEAKELIRINAILTVCPYSSQMIYPSCILGALILTVWPSTNIRDLTVCYEGIMKEKALLFVMKEKALLSVPSTLNLRLCPCSRGRRHGQQYHPLYLPPAHWLSSTYTGWESPVCLSKCP